MGLFSMGSKILRLSSEVIDQIAAGEVVERPSHMVKELIENAIDAQANQMDIEIQMGGRSVQIQDDGVGMNREDLSLALDRHATSKICSSSDLWCLQSYGFRGEALASIASVSKLTLTSKGQGDTTLGHQIRSDFGHTSEVYEVSSSQGTTVRIESLFENVPARLKFLRSDSSEISHIKTVVRAMALAHPKIQFRLLQDGKLQSFWPPCSSELKRVEQVLSISTAYFTESFQDSSHVRMVFGNPRESYPTSKNIYLFVNQRWVQDRSLYAAVTEAYRNLLMTKQYPLAVVWVEVDPSSVDVNIHPTKSQVKFQDPSRIFRLVQSTLRSALEEAPWLSSETSSMSSSKSNGTTRDDFRSHYEQTSLWSTIKDSESPPIAEFGRTHYAQKLEPLEEASSPRNEESHTSLEIGPEVSERGYWSSLQVIGQAHLTYIVAQSEKALILIDQHAAHERIVFEDLMNCWKSQSRPNVQNLLIPLTLDFSEDCIESLLASKEELERVGIEIDAMGPSSLVVRAHPVEIRERGLVQALERLAHERLRQGESFALETWMGELFASMACHSVIRAGQPLSQREMVQLLSDMDRHPLSSFCPHGRPVSVEYPFSKMERDFGRTV